jgi:type VII secretion protein EccB
VEKGGGWVSGRSTTALRVSGYRFLLRRVERALHGGRSVPARAAPLTLGWVLAAVAVAGCAVLAVLRPQPDLDRARIVIARESGALYVRVGETWHPVLNVVSARLIAGADTGPRLVSESDLRRTKRGPLLGIPGGPQFAGRPLPAADLAFSICDSGGAAGTTVIIGHPGGDGVARLTTGRAMLVAPAWGSPAYLLYNGHRAMVDLADAAVVRALRLEGRAPQPVSPSLLNAVPEAPPFAAPRIHGLGGAAPGLPGFRVGSVLRITRADGDEYYAVLAAGVQRIGQVAADLVRFSNRQGTANPVTVAPDAIRAAPVVTELPVAGFPDRAPTLADPAGTVCASWEEMGSARAEVAFLAGTRPPVPSGQAAVTLAQADGGGPALDGVYVPPGRSAYVRAGDSAGTRYLITDTGVRFAIHDDDAAHDLGLAEATPAPWPLLTLLPAGPELSRHNASTARDTVAGSP